MAPQIARPLPRSLYAETAEPAVDAPPLGGDARTAVAIVGGGYTGLSTALHLAERGVDATVLEANEPGWGASGRNGGQVNPGLKHDPDRIERDFGPELGRRMVGLAWGAPDEVFALIRRHQIVCEARQGGTVRAAYGAARMAEIRATAEQLGRRGAPVELLDAAGTAAVAGTRRYLGALLDPRGGSVNPLGYARGLARAARNAGAKVHRGTPALRLEREGAGWRVETPAGRVRAGHVVLATNGYTDGLWPRLRRTVAPVFSAIAATEPLPGPLARAIMPSGAVLYEHAAITVYYRLDRDGRLLMGGRSALRDTSDPADYRTLVRYAGRLWPGLGGVRWTHFWNGQLAITADHYPHLHEPAPGVIACLGYNGRGIAMATVMGREVARRILGATEIDMPVTPLRPMPLHGLWRAGARAAMAYGRLRDRLTAAAA